MEFGFDYNYEKNELLKEIRGVDFEDIIDCISKGHLLDDIPHFKKAKYPDQRIFVIKVNSYIYLVPYVVDKEKRKLFLKTIYPSRKFNKKYLKNE